MKNCRSRKIAEGWRTSRHPERQECRSSRVFEDHVRRDHDDRERDHHRRQTDAEEDAAAGKADAGEAVCGNGTREQHARQAEHDDDQRIAGVEQEVELVGMRDVCIRGVGLLSRQRFGESDFARLARRPERPWQDRGLESPSGPKPTETIQASGKKTVIPSRRVRYTWRRSTMARDQLSYDRPRPTSVLACLGPIVNLPPAGQ